MVIAGCRKEKNVKAEEVKIGLLNPSQIREKAKKGNPHQEIWDHNNHVSKHSRKTPYTMANQARDPGKIFKKILSLRQLLLDRTFLEKCAQVHQNKKKLENVYYNESQDTKFWK